MGYIKMKNIYGYSLVLFSFLILSSNANSNDCIPEVKGDKVKIEIYNNKGEKTYEQHHKVINDNRVKDLVIIGLENFVVLSRHKSDYGPSINYDGDSGISLSMYQPDKSMVANIGGCKINRLDAVFFPYKKKLIHSGALKLDKARLNLSKKGDVPKNWSESKKGIISDNNFIAFGIPLGEVFSKNLFKKIIKSQDNGEIVSHVVTPKKPNPFFDGYIIYVHKEDNRIFKVFAIRNYAINDEKSKINAEDIKMAVKNKYSYKKGAINRYPNRNDLFTYSWGESIGIGNNRKSRYNVTFETKPTPSKIINGSPSNSVVLMYKDNYKIINEHKKKIADALKIRKETPTSTEGL